MKIDIIRGDITTMQVGAIVNAANSGLLGGGGVDGSIHRAAGIGLLEECRAIRSTHGECMVGEVVITKGYNLPSEFIIHAVGPVWRDGNHNEDELLLKCYKNALEIARQHSITSLAFPNISTGVYKFPKKRAAELVSQYFNTLKETKQIIKTIQFVCFDEENYRLYTELF